MNVVIKAIRHIKADKIQRGVFPVHATRRELLDFGCPVEEIRKSVKDRLVRFGRTLNDFYFVEVLSNEKK